VNIEEDVQWSKAFDRIEYSDGNAYYNQKVYLENLGNDTMYAGIGNIRKTIPVRVNKLCRKDLPPDSCILTLQNFDNEGTNITKKYLCGEKVIIEATFSDTCCSKFLHWEDNFGKIISQKSLDTIILTTDSVLIAVFEKQDFITITLISNPPEAYFEQDFLGEQKFDCGQSHLMYSGFPADGWAFDYWEVAPNDNITIADNLVTITPLCSDATLIAHFKKVDLPSEVRFTIRADTHKLVDPSRRNYRVPIYITADKDISNYTIEKLVVNFDKNIYVPRNIVGNNGTMTRNFIDSTIEVIIENIKIPDLKSGVESVLLTIRGDMILAHKDSADIDLREVIFAQTLNEEPELIDGYITLDICETGGDSRYLASFGYSPSIIIYNNPATEKLEVEIKVIENGNYTLEIVDIMGKTELVKEFSISKSDEKEMEFEIPLMMYGNGAYLLVLTTPTERYTSKFVIKK
jgi:hypothetical protein